MLQSLGEQERFGGGQGILGFKVQGFGFGLGFRGSGFRVQGFVFGLLKTGSGFRHAVLAVLGFFRALGLWSFRVRVHGLGIEP